MEQSARRYLRGASARTIAELLDQDGDGVPDVPAVQEALRTGSPTAPVFACGTNKDEEDGLDKHNMASAYVFSSQSYGRDLQDAQNTIFHESHHMVHQQGWAFVWPEKFGYISFFADVVEAAKYYKKRAEAGRHLCGESGFGEAACLANACCQWDDGECFLEKIRTLGHARALIFPSVALSR